MMIIKGMKGFAIIETRQMSKRHFIIRLEVPEEVFIFVNSFRGGYPWKWSTLLRLKNEGHRSNSFYSIYNILSFI